MATSSILHSGEQTPVTDKGHGTDALGPSNTSDSGSDVRGAQIFPEGDMGELDTDTDEGGTGERAAATPDVSAREARDIGVDRVVTGSEIGATDDRPRWADPDHANDNDVEPNLSAGVDTQESAEDVVADEEEQAAEILREEGPDAPRR